MSYSACTFFHIHACFCVPLLFKASSTCVLGSSLPSPLGSCCAVLCLVAQSCPTLCNSMDYSMPGSSIHGDSPGKSTTGVGCHALLQGIFPIQGLNPDLPHCRQILYCLSLQGSPRIPEWVAYPFSRGTFQPRNRIRVTCLAGGFFTC